MHLEPVPLSREAFAPFGEVVELEHARQFPINQGLTTRFHDLLTIDVADQGGYPLVNVFRTSPLLLPHRVAVMERHPLGSQAFLPLGSQPFLVLLAQDVVPFRPSDFTLFKANGYQGVNLRKNTWHHFQIVLHQTQDFIVIDRGGEGRNLEERVVDDEILIPEL